MMILESCHLPQNTHVLECEVSQKLTVLVESAQATGNMVEAGFEHPDACFQPC